jgi:TetR/AcrR family transcriptional repressor of nem operon
LSFTEKQIPRESPIFFDSETDVKKGFKRLFEMSIDESIKDTDKKGCFVVNTTTELVPGEEKIYTILEENRKNFRRSFL